MEKRHPIDDLFRHGLADYEVSPSDERRTAFIREAMEQGRRPSSSWKWILSAALILLVTGITIMMIPGTGKQESEKLKSNAGNPVRSTVQPQSSLADHGRTIVQSQSNVSDRWETSKQLNDKSGAIITGEAMPIKAVTAVMKKDEAVVKEDVAEVKMEVAAVAMNEAVIQEDVAVVKENEVAGEMDMAAVQEDTVTVVKRDTVAVEDEKREPASGENRTRNAKWHLSAGIYYGPEWMFNTLNGDKFVNNTGFEGTFHFGPYSVRTGLGISITTGSNEIMVQTNPYEGNYNALDSISFQWDEQRLSLLPTYHTTGTQVFDTARLSNEAYVKKRYTYLQVPLVLGYDFWRNDWISLGFRAGAVMSLLLKSETLSGTYDPGMDRIISINMISPDRIQLNWQAIGGVNAAFRLSQRFGLEVEPNIRYYFNSVYESSELTKKPWSLGVRAAFIIHF